jgi:hypothetical protein
MPNKKRAFLDAKYKFGGNDVETDIYQIFTYMTACDVEFGAIIRPTDDEEAEKIEIRTTVTGRRVAFFRLNFRSFLEAEKNLSGSLAAFFSLPAGSVSSIAGL